MENRVQLEHYVKDTYDRLTEQYFGGQYEYCYQTGSFVYGGGTLGKSDLDVTVVFKDNILNVPKPSLLQKLDLFINGYLKLHKELGFEPDTTFPGEFVTASMVRDSVAGRGFHANADNTLYLPKASTEYFLTDTETWYRAWLSQSAFNVFLKGNKDLWRQNKIDGWGTLLLFKAGTDFQNTPFTIDNFFDALRIYGVHKDYYEFRSSEQPYVEEVFSNAERNGSLTKRDDLYIPNGDIILEQHRKLGKSINDGSIRRSQLLLNMEETLAIAQETERKWQEIS